MKKHEAPEVNLPAGINPWRVRILMLSLAHTVGTACYLSIMAMGPVIRGDLSISSADFGFFMSAVFGAQLLSSIPSGAITDRFGVGWTLVGALLLIVFGTLVFSASSNFSWAMFGAFTIGLGYSFVNPATAKGVVYWFPAEWRGTAMGVKQLGVPLGGVLGAGGGALAAYMDWRIVLWIAAGVTFSVALAWLACVRKPKQDADAVSTALRNLRTVMTNTNMNVICASCVLYNSAQSSLFAYMALFLRDAASANQPIAAAGVATAQAASAVGRVGYSYLSDTVFGGRRKAMVLAIVLAGGASCVAAYFVSPDWPHWSLMALALFMGGTIAAYAALVLAMTADTVPSSLVGTAIGYNSLSWSLGGMAGPPLFGLILDKTGGNYGTAWIILGAIMLMGALFMAGAYKETAGRR